MEFHLAAREAFVYSLQQSLMQMLLIDPQPSTATVCYRTTRFYECPLTLHALCEFLSPACQSQSGGSIFGIILQHPKRFADRVRLPLRADLRY